MDTKDAKLELKKIVDKYRKHNYSFWRSMIETKEVITFGFTSEKGHRYQVEIQAIYDGEKGGPIKVIFSIDDGGWRAFVPLCDGFIMNDRNEFIGE